MPQVKLGNKTIRPQSGILQSTLCDFLVCGCFLDRVFSLELSVASLAAAANSVLEEAKKIRTESEKSENRCRHEGCDQQTKSSEKSSTCSS